MQHDSKSTAKRIMGWLIYPTAVITLCSMFLMLAQGEPARSFEQGMAALEKGDYAEAYCIWRPLASQGDAKAAYHLGWLYANGNGLRVDLKQAVYWWSQAAAQGHTDAQFALGMTYANGDEDVEADPDKALEWYMKAADGGHQDARDIIRTMLAEDAPEVQSRLSELIAKPWVGRPIRVVGDRVNLRSGPGTEFSQIDAFEKGTVLKAVGKRGDWIRVLRQGEKTGFGWIAGWLTEPVK